MKKNFKLEDWQKIIINWLTQLKNTSQFPTWKIVLQELNIHQKCETSLKNHLKLWYKSYCNDNEFPPHPVNLPEGVDVLSEGTTSKIKTKTVLDVNKNKVQIILPFNLKNHLSLKEGKQMVLNYIREQNIDIIITNWTTISKKLSYNYKYSLESREPVKKWYDQHRQKYITQLENQGKNGFDSKNRSIKSIEVLIDNSNKTNLGNQLVLIFNQMKNQLVNNSIYTDSKITLYYEAFFQQFASEMWLQNCIINHGFQGLEIMNRFHSVFDLNSFKDYLESSPGLYPKLVLWTINNPFPVKELEIEHHAMPKFLEKSGFNLKEEIEKPYNVVYVSRIIHYFMHLVRLNEYAQPQDSNAVQLMLRNQASSISVSWGSNSLQNIAKIMYNSLNNKMLENSPNYEQNVSAKRKQQIRELAITKMAPETLQILSSKSVWRHTKDENFEYIHYPQDPNNCSLDDFTRTFIKAYTNYQKLYKQKLFFDEKNVKGVRELFGVYFRGRTTKIYEFYMVDPPDFIKPLTKN